jgi:flagellar biosynthetic protein FlhB
MSDNTEDDDRTEEPTLRKLEEAINKGDVARSVEIGTFFVLCGLTLALMITSGAAMRDSSLALRSFLMNAHMVPAEGSALLGVTTRGLLTGFGASALLLLMLIFAGLAGALVQHRPLWTLEPLAPKLDRISPLAGLKRMFGKEALANFIKGLAKVLIVGIVVSVVLWSERDRFEAFARLDLTAVLPAVLNLTIKLLASVLAIYAFVAIGDFVYQKMSWYKRQRMTRQELKDEYKNTEGNPEIKAKLRQLRAQKLKRRMMANVPKATVVITNPTHFAVALQYEQGMPAPICVAKGVEAVALRIREIAGDAGVPIIENRPLARALYATVEIDEEIPTEHYQAVAEVIGYVLRLKRRRA